MASISMTVASLLSGSALSQATTVTSTPRGLIIANSAKMSWGESVSVVSSGSDEEKREGGRRELVFAAAAAAAAATTLVCSAGGSSAVAAREPKPGSKEAKKLYAPVCVSNPTAKICRS